MIKIVLLMYKIGYAIGDWFHDYVLMGPVTREIKSVMVVVSLKKGKYVNRKEYRAMMDGRSGLLYASYYLQPTGRYDNMEDLIKAMERIAPLWKWSIN